MIYWIEPYESSGNYIGHGECKIVPVLITQQHAIKAY
jgi:hypothetical protein